MQSSQTKDQSSWSADSFFPPSEPSLSSYKNMYNKAKTGYIFKWFQGLAEFTAFCNQQFLLGFVSTISSCYTRLLARFLIVPQISFWEELFPLIITSKAPKYILKNARMGINIDFKSRFTKCFRKPAIYTSTSLLRSISIWQFHTFSPWIKIQLWLLWQTPIY